MSGLVIGLQNRAQRFESASDLQRKHLTTRCFFVCNGVAKQYFHTLFLISKIIVEKKTGKTLFLWICFINFVTK